jgi:hypothetical protein
MHAKMTRDRKKQFIGTVETTIAQLESEVSRMKGILSQVSALQMVTPITSPEIKPVESPLIDSDDVSVYSTVADEDDQSSTKKARHHGFSLND